MHKLMLFFLLISLLQVGCKKSQPDTVQPSNIEETKYQMRDSVIRVYGNMGGVLQENRYPLNGDITIFKNIASAELVYLSDTFIVYQTVPLRYVNKHGSFPLLGFMGDSLSISRRIGGIGQQTWEYLQCVKY